MVDTPIQNNGAEKKPSFIVAIGASAGGLNALEQLFDHMPIDTGMAFVVIQHLSPDFKSLMDDLLARRTSMPILIVTSGTGIQPDTIYLIPPKTSMTISGEKLYLTEKTIGSHVELPIDIFFNSLARDVGARAVGVVLSGSGSDGSRGVVAIHNQGGLVVVQSPESAQFDSMPRSAIDHIAYHLADQEEMLENVRKVLITGIPDEKEEKTKDGADGSFPGSCRSETRQGRWKGRS